MHATVCVCGSECVALYNPETSAVCVCGVFCQTRVGRMCVCPVLVAFASVFFVYIS